MAQTGVVSWSQTAASNASADSNVNWAEGMAPSAVNDSARAEMSSVAKYRDDNAGSLTTAGTSTAYTLTTNQVFSALTVLNGQEIAVKFNATNGASPTLNVDSLGAKAIKIDTTNAVPTGALKANTIWTLVYDNSNGVFIIKGFPQVLGATSLAGPLTLSSVTTAGRPAAAAGLIEYNSDNTAVEYSDGASFFSLLSKLSGAQLPYGTVINGTIVESHSGNAATFAVKTLAGADPSAGDPVLISFRNPTAATGNYIYRTLTAALSLTLSSGSTIGASNGVPFRVWLVLFDDAATIRLGAINCWNGSSIYPLCATPIASSTAEGGLGAAGSAKIFYTGTAVTSKSYVPLGYCDYSSGLVTAGAWATSPTTIQLFGAAVKLPGATIQSIYATSTTQATATSTTKVATDLAATIARTSTANPVLVRANGPISQNSGTTIGAAAVSRDGGTNFVGNFSMTSAASASDSGTCACIGIEVPTTASVTYTLYIWGSGVCNMQWIPTFPGGARGVMVVDEIMG